MSEKPAQYPAYDQAALEALARARAAIEGAIATLKAHRRNLTEGQIKELKRILYDAPEAEQL